MVRSWPSCHRCIRLEDSDEFNKAIHIIALAQSEAENRIFSYSTGGIGIVGLLYTFASLSL